MNNAIIGNDGNEMRINGNVTMHVRVAGGYVLECVERRAHRNAEAAAAYATWYTHGWSK